jgi:hypothetical protein
MTKRVYIGQIGGQFDCRIARPGFSADLDDVYDRKKISFSAIRGSYAKFAEGGNIGAADTDFPYSQSYSPVPLAIGTINIGGTGTMGLGIQRRYVNGVTTDTCDGTVAVVVPSTGSIRITNAARRYQTFDPGDLFNYFIIQPVG